MSPFRKGCAADGQGDWSVCAGFDLWISSKLSEAIKNSEAQAVSQQMGCGQRDGIVYLDAARPMRGREESAVAVRAHPDTLVARALR